MAYKDQWNLAIDDEGEFRELPCPRLPNGAWGSHSRRLNGLAGLTCIGLAGYLMLWQFLILMEWKRELESAIICGRILWPVVAFDYGGAGICLVMGLVSSLRGNGSRGFQFAAAAIFLVLRGYWQGV